jgi:hypothetical protein
MRSTAETVLSGLFGNLAAIYVVLIVVGVVMVVTFVVAWIVIVLKNINREWPTR